MKFISTCFLIIDEIHACRSRAIITGSPECEVKEAHLSQLGYYLACTAFNFSKRLIRETLLTRGNQ
jgi:hypothetical protein